MENWMWWLIVAAAFGVPLVVTALPEFGMFAIGAGAAALTGGLGGGTVAQFAVFLGISVALLVFVRPIAMRHLRQGPRIRMGIDALTGASAVVLEQVDEHDGRIKLQGEVWSARAFEPGRVYEPGQQVSVAQIDGATALVL
ncbi:membrane protein implicated in regulation of membrane protease activity [Streptacidiphilus sp. EB129]